MTVSRRRLLTGSLPGKRSRRAIFYPGVPPLSVGEDLDMLRDLALCLLTGLVAPVMYQFVLQRGKKLSIGALS